MHSPIRRREKAKKEGEGRRGDGKDRSEARFSVKLDEGKKDKNIVKKSDF